MVKPAPELDRSEVERKLSVLGRVLTGKAGKKPVESTANEPQRERSLVAQGIATVVRGPTQAKVRPKCPDWFDVRVYRTLDDEDAMWVARLPEPTGHWLQRKRQADQLVEQAMSRRNAKLGNTGGP